MNQEHTKDIQPNAAFQRRLISYSALAAAGACAVATAPKAEAAVVSSGPLSISVPLSATGTYFNLSTFVSATTFTGAGGGTSPVLNLWGSATTQAWLYPTASTINRFVSSGTTTLDAAGLTVGPTSTFGTSTTPGAYGTAGGFVAGQTGYLGMQFLNGATTEYGWVQIYWPGATPTAANPVKILSAAYENTGAAITVPAAIPEPGTVGCLAAGVIGAGALAWRRRKAA